MVIGVVARAVKRDRVLQHGCLRQRQRRIVARVIGTVHIRDRRRPVDLIVQLAAVAVHDEVELLPCLNADLIRLELIFMSVRAVRACAAAQQLPAFADRPDRDDRAGLVGLIDRDAHTVRAFAAPFAGVPPRNVDFRSRRDRDRAALRRGIDHSGHFAAVHDLAVAEEVRIAPVNNCGVRVIAAGNAGRDRPLLIGLDGNVVQLVHDGKARRTGGRLRKGPVSRRRVALQLVRAQSVRRGIVIPRAVRLAQILRRAGCQRASRA